MRHHQRVIRVKENEIGAELDGLRKRKSEAFSLAESRSEQYVEGLLQPGLNTRP